MKTFKVLSCLLAYPSPDMVAALPELKAVLITEGLLSSSGRRLLQPLFEDFASADPTELQERYVFLFDRTRSLSLHLFEHVHGESRDRGQAMVDLKRVHEDAGRRARTVCGPEARTHPDLQRLFHWKDQDLHEPRHSTQVAREISRTCRGGKRDETAPP